MPRIFVSDQTAQIRDTISSWLADATLSAGYSYSPTDLTLKLVDQNGEIIGGLTGATNWNWLYIETLAISPDHRNQGHARELVSKAEEVARERGCIGCWVDTFSFQVPEFYLHLGYQQFGELPGYPDDQSRIFLRKKL